MMKINAALQCLAAAIDRKVRHMSSQSFRNNALLMSAAIAISLLLPLPFLTVRAQTGSATEAADAAAIKQVVAAYMDGWNSRDAHALAMLFTEDGDYTTVGGSNTHGRKDMEEMFVRLLTTGMFRESHRTDSVKRIRFLAPGVASVDDYWSVEGVIDRPPLEGLYAWVMVKQNGRWLTAVHHATNFAPSSAAPVRNGR
jgi:uncharacterized protein (TIGR02246 family)